MHIHRLTQSRNLPDPPIHFSAPLSDDLQLTPAGTGPLYQRDYWAVIDGCSGDPEEVMRVVRRQFKQLAPSELAAFSRSPDCTELIEEGEEMYVKIRMASEVRVRVVHVSDFSLTIATMEGHPEAGKITFGAYQNSHGDVVFHIRSRARSKSPMDLVGFHIAGDAMQTNTWTDFIDRLAHTVGCGVIGEIQAEKQNVDEIECDEDVSAPTFIAQKA